MANPLMKAMEKRMAAKKAAAKLPAKAVAKASATKQKAIGAVDVLKNAMKKRMAGMK